MKDRSEKMEKEMVSVKEWKIKVSKNIGHLTYMVKELSMEKETNGLTIINGPQRRKDEQDKIWK